ncbi:hypothetical protein KBC04_05625 [Candidatus Babeliales bacterium]|nr:hypothetical protein [Candidatus Babeliales bacterium]MBP9843842.1 hypothetical protein [Candidatus Babeliales bacterium]
MKNFKILFFVLFVTVFSKVYTYESTQLDVMADFAYPVSMMENIRYNMGQAVYALQHADSSSSASFLEQAASNLGFRQMVSDDDRQFIQEMIDKINALIKDLEDDTDRSCMIDLSQQIQDKL